MESEASAELVVIYLEESREHLAALDEALLRLEREGPSAEIAGSLMGPLHTLKGNSGMIGFVAVKDYVHRLEDVFARAREGVLALDAIAVDRLLQGAAALRVAVEAACASGSERTDLGPEKAVLADLLAGAFPAASLATDAPRSGRVGEGALGSPRSATVRVDFARLDQLLNTVGELVVHRTRLEEIARNVQGVAPAAGRELLEAVHALAGVSAELQATVMDVRMLPIRHVFERFPRLVRDLARGQGKQVELVLQGEATRVDKAVIDELGEPLVHLVRNAVDHGIEPPAVRSARGKPATGTLLLAAAQESNQVVITLLDDGGGIDAAEIRRRALERGLLKEGEVLSDREAIQFVFTAGFSTARTVTDVSGRGVGLDVVVRSVERLGGLVEAETIPGAGTKFTLQLPLTLAMITVLMVEAGDSTYALPFASVVESLRYRRTELVRMNGRDTLRVRDRIVPLVHLSELAGGAKQSAEDAYAIVLGRGDKRLGVTVDRLLGQQDVVIKALDPLVSEAAVAIAGATVLSDGRVVLILDVASLFEGGRASAALRARAAEA